MKKAKIVINYAVSETDDDGINGLVELKKQIDSGEFQRDSTKSGVRKVTATFEWIKE